VAEKNLKERGGRDREMSMGRIRLWISNKVRHGKEEEGDGKRGKGGLSRGIVVWCSSLLKKIRHKKVEHDDEAREKEEMLFWYLSISKNLGRRPEEKGPT